LFFNLCKRKFYRFGAVVDDGHWEGSSKKVLARQISCFLAGNGEGLNWISKGL